MASTNAELRDLLISHQIGLQRLTNQEVQDLLAILARSERQIRALIRARYGRLQVGDIGYGTKLRLNQMLLEIHEARRVAIMELYEPLASSLEEFAAYEQSYLTDTMRKAMPSRIPFDPTLASAELLRSIVRSQPFEGKLLRDHFRALTRRNGIVARKIKRLVEEGLAMGTSPVSITRRIDYEALRITRSNVQAIVQTSMSHVTNAMRDGYAQGNQDVVKGQQWVGTLDSKICSICIVRDGHTYGLNHEPLDGGPPWGAGPGRMHYNDRCTSTMVLKSWEELGIDAKELTGAERASMDGFVDADTTAEAWVARQSDARLTQMFGPERVAMLKDGRIKNVSDLWKKDGTLLTLKELGRAEGVAVGGFKTMAEADAWMKSQGISTRFPNLETANEVIDALSDANPAAREVLSFIGDEKALHDWAKRTGNTKLKMFQVHPDGTAGYFDIDMTTYKLEDAAGIRLVTRDGRSLIVMDKFDSARHAKMVADWPDDWSLTKTLRGTVRHEMGHVEESILRKAWPTSQTGLRASQDAFSSYEMWERAFASAKSSGAVGLSRIATMEAGEAFAEMSLARMSGQSIPQWMVDVLKHMEIDDVPWEKLLAHDPWSKP